MLMDALQREVDALSAEVTRLQLMVYRITSAAHWPPSQARSLVTDHNAAQSGKSNVDHRHHHHHHHHHRPQHSTDGRNHGHGHETPNEESQHQFDGERQHMQELNAVASSGIGLSPDVLQLLERLVEANRNTVATQRRRDDVEETGAPRESSRRRRTSRREKKKKRKKRKERRGYSTSSSVSTSSSDSDSFSVSKQSESLDLMSRKHHKGHKKTRESHESSKGQKEVSRTTPPSPQKYHHKKEEKEKEKHIDVSLKSNSAYSPVMHASLPSSTSGSHGALRMPPLGAPNVQHSPLSVVSPSEGDIRSMGPRRDVGHHSLHSGDVSIPMQSRSNASFSFGSLVPMSAKDNSVYNQLQSNFATPRDMHVGTPGGFKDQHEVSDNDEREGTKYRGDEQENRSDEDEDGFPLIGSSVPPFSGQVPSESSEQPPHLTGGATFRAPLRRRSLMHRLRGSSSSSKSGEEDSEDERSDINQEGSSESRLPSISALTGEVFASYFQGGSATKKAISAGVQKESPDTLKQSSRSLQGLEMLDEYEMAIHNSFQHNGEMDEEMETPRYRDERDRSSSSSPNLYRSGAFYHF